MALTALLAGGALLAGIGEEIAKGNALSPKNNPNWDPHKGGYTGSGSVTSRVTNYITQGGRPEYQNATSHPKTLSVYNEPYAKQNGAEYGTFEFYRTPQGSYTRDLSQVANISMDDKGAITVTIPDKWQDDKQVKDYVDDYMLKTLSGNYKMNKDVQYQDPYDETKQIKTQEYIDKLNEALKFRISALDATAPTKANVIARYGGTDEKNKVANNLSTEDIIIMSATFKNDDDWVPIPAYMLLAYPQIANLETYKDTGFVQKKDFLENFYNIESGKITEENAYGIATTPEKMLAEIEDMEPEEIARTIAFGNFIGQVDPKRSNWEQFLQAGDALSRGFYGGFYDWFVGTSDLVANVANFTFINGNTIETRDFWNGIMGGGTADFDPTKYMGEQMQYMAYTNKDALSKAQAGYVQGRLAGQAVDVVVSTIAIGEATKALSTAITSKLVEKGAEKTAVKMAEAADYGAKAGDVADLNRLSNTRIANPGDIEGLYGSLGKVASGGAKYKAFFSQTWNEAFTLYTKALGGTSAMLQSMGPAQLAGVINSASRIATTASFANTAVNVLGSMVIAAVVSDKELTTKVLSSKATSDEAKEWISQVMWDTAKLSAISWFGGIAAQDANNTLTRFFNETKLGSMTKEFGQKASQKTMGFTRAVSHPWLTFMKWYLNKKAVAGKVSNATAASTEALKEAILADEMRAYGANLSTQPGSYGTKIIEQYLDITGVERGVTMSETLQNLSRAGIVLDPATLELSEFEAWQSDYVAAQNALTNWNDVTANASQVVHEFTSPDIYPTISQNMTEMNKANTELLNAEKEAGLLSKNEIKANKKILKSDEGYIYAMHSPELSRFIVRNYELRITENDARRKGVTDLDNYQPYIEAKDRYTKALEKITPKMQDIALNRYMPALMKAEYNIVDVMVGDKVYSRKFVEAMRASGKYGKDGTYWMRLVAKKDLPKGTYNPYSKVVKQDNLIGLTKFRVLEDDEITWPGNGLQELITEYGAARAEKKFVKESKAATGKTTEVVMSGEKTRSAALMKEYREDFLKTVKQGIRSFAQTASGTVAIGKTRTAEQDAFLKEVAITGGVNTIDIDTLRAVMQDKGLTLAEDVVDQESLDKFLSESSEEARKLIIDAVGEKMGAIEITEETFPELMGNETVQKILRGELEKTSLQTGYGIKDTRARLNAQVPGFDVLDWSLLGREHVNGLIPGGFYAGMDDNIVKSYIISTDDLKKLLDLPEKAPASQLSSMGEKFWKHINTIDGNAVIPLRLSTNVNDRGRIRFYPRGGKSMGEDIPDSGHLALYVEALEKQGITKVPVAISFNKAALRHENRIRKFFDAIDESIATGKRPKITEEDVYYALKELISKERVVRRIRNSVPESVMSDKDIDTLVENAKKYRIKPRTDDDIDFEAQIKDTLDANSRFQNIGLRDITNDVQKAFSEYGKIPFYHGQVGDLSKIRYNDEGRTPTGDDAYIGAGDAYWLAPNASYTDVYGKNKGAGYIPLKYFMSDKEKHDEIRKIYARIIELEKKMKAALDKSGLEIANDANIKDATLSRIEDAERRGLSDNLEDLYPGEVQKAKDILRGALTKKELAEYNELSKILDVGNVTGNGIVEADKHSIKSYRALAERVGKPVVDISNDNFADGTAFLYYTGISPDFDKEMGEWFKAQHNAVGKDVSTKKGKDEWAAIDPRNVANVPTDPEFEQPREVSYQDYERGLAEDPDLDSSILEAIKDEQYSKLEEFKNKNTEKYETLINKVDRANALKNTSVTESTEVQKAAEEFKNNVKDFEKSVLENEKFSYMIKSETTKNNLSAFAKENGIDLPEGKGSVKSKLKSALWQKVLNGEELPKIKGLKKSDVKAIKDALDAVSGDEKVAKEFKKNFYKLLDETDVFKNAGGPNPLKYELDTEALYNDIDEAISDLLALIKSDPNSNVVIKSIAEYQGYFLNPARYEFTVLSELLSSEGKKAISDTVKDLARRIVNNLIPQKQTVIMGNVNSLYDKVEKAIMDKLESRFAMAKAQLESAGEKADSSTISELLEENQKEIKGIESDKTIIKTSDDNGEIQYERVSPTIADIYNERPTYTPLGTPMQILNNLAVLKKISMTDTSPRSFAKQASSDTAMGFATVGAIPGTLQALRDEISSQFGPAVLRAMEKNDPMRYANIQAIAAREGISEEAAFTRNSEAIAKTQVPFTLLNRELLQQMDVSKFGNEGAIISRGGAFAQRLNRKINSGLRRVSDVLGKPQNMRETYERLLAGEKAFKTALQKGYSLEQAENFREHALNTATTNFRQKHTVFNLLRSTVPYITSGISGAKSFWKMFELDPVGVSSRIFTGFILPIMYFAGEIFSDENLRQKYEDLAESEKNNHIVIAVGGELILIPVGEELGQYTNLAIHVVETLHNENNYDFWNLMLNDLVNFIPGVDLTGFTDPEMWEPLSRETPNFLEVTENGIGKVLASTMPPIFQSIYMANTGRDLYTGRPIDTSYVQIDEDGNAQIMSKSTSEFAKALASVVGGDAKMIEKIVSGISGTTALHILDTVTSAAQFVGSKGEEGSLTTGVEKALNDLAAPYTAHGYNALERRLNYAVSGLFRKKEEIEKSDEYVKYNQEISKEKDSKKRQNLISKRNDLLRDYQKKVEALVKGYRAAGGSLDKWKFSKVVSLLTFEGAINADRQFMELNTNYSDAYKQAMQTLYNMGITNPDGPSSLGYIYTDKEGNPKIAMWTPAQIQIMQNAFYEQNDIHTARIKAIIDDGTEESLKKQLKAEKSAEDQYWSKAKMTNADYDAIDELRKAYDAKVVLALTDYMNTYGAANVLSNDAVIDYLNDIIRVPSSYEKVKGRFVSADNGKLNKQTGFAESYIKTIFGVKK